MDKNIESEDSTNAAESAPSGKGVEYFRIDPAGWIPPGPRRKYVPRPIAKSSSIEETTDLNNENLANAMTEDFRVSMSRGAFYDDNADMDQQSQEFWDKS